MRRLPIGILSMLCATVFGQTIETVTIEYDAEKTNVEKLLKAFPKFGCEAKSVEPKTPQKSK